MMFEMHGETVEAVCDGRACRAAASIFWAEHEVINDKL
jgi:hypothetical protein